LVARKAYETVVVKANHQFVLIRADHLTGPRAGSDRQHDARGWPRNNMCRQGFAFFFRGNGWQGTGDSLYVQILREIL
jgi:hypothetical protein